MNTVEAYPIIALDEQTTRQILQCGDSLMLVAFRFSKGGGGSVHSHDRHEQAGLVVKGTFELTVGETKRLIQAGDTYCAPRNVLHGVRALEDDSMIVDSFSPIRTDFL